MLRLLPRIRLQLSGTLAFVCLLTGLQPVMAEKLPVQNDTVWLDTAGREIGAQGGSMLRIGRTFYWYGFDGGPDHRNGAPVYASVKCYSSTDLVNWKLENVVFAEAGKVPNRMDVIFSPVLKKYVMITKQMQAQKGVGIAVCDTPTGVFKWTGYVDLPESVGGGDQSVFVDDDGKAYIVYTPWAMDNQTGKMVRNRDLICAEMAPDCLSVSRVVCRMTNTRLEAPAIFKRSNRYYWMASGVAWWYSSGTSWCTSTKLEGPWTPWAKLESPRPASHPLATQMLRDSYNSQHDFVLPVKGTGGTVFMYCGDRYSNFTTFGVGRNVWLPLEFRGDTPVLDWFQTWYIDAEKGAWSSSMENR